MHPVASRYAVNEQGPAPRHPDHRVTGGVRGAERQHLDGLFAGDLLFIGGTPMMWSGTIENRVAACDRMLALDPAVVVPGRGPVAGPAGIRQVRDYLTFLDGYARNSLAAVRSWREAAAEIDLGPCAAWGEPERTVANLYGAYRSLEPATEEITPLELLTAVAAGGRT